MKKFLALLSIVFCLTAAPLTSASARSFNITDIVRASDTDLTAALTDATAQNDVFAMQCYSGALAYNAANPQRKLFSGVEGPVSGFQATRDIVKSANTGNVVPPELVQACGPLALDALHDVNHTALSILGLKLF